jgi:hypothetical protein
MQLKKVSLIAPSSYQEALCETFSQEVYHTNRKTYMARHNHDDKASARVNGFAELKFKADIYIGKMAEFAVYNFISAQGKSVTFPDIEIYHGRKKSFDADLTVNNETPIHVKSCMENNGYDNSWLFQPNDKLTTEPSDNEVIFLVSISPTKEFNAYILKAIDYVGHYENPRNEQLKKKVIYESTLIELT